MARSGAAKARFDHLAAGQGAHQPAEDGAQALAGEEHEQRDPGRQHR